MIRLATKSDIEGIKTIFKERFTTDKEYLNMVFSYLFPKSKCYIYKDNEKICSTLFLIPITYNTPSNSYNGYYLYGVATLKTETGKGLAKKLLNHIKEISIKENKDFIICRPAEESLFKYYTKLGYYIQLAKVPFKISPIISMYLSSPNIASQLLQSEISQYPNHFMWSLDLLEYMITIGEIESHIKTQNSNISNFLLLNPLNPELNQINTIESLFIFPME